MTSSGFRVRDLAATAVTSGGRQNFLGGRQVEVAMRYAPARYQRQLALRLLALSPHYFYDPDLRAEDARCRTSRLEICERVVLPYTGSGTRAIDFGCGPGYLASAVAGSVAQVRAVDVSRGVLACAEVLCPGPNIEYLTPAQLDRQSTKSELAYSFAVAQHLPKTVLSASLTSLSRHLTSGATLLMHFARPGAFRSEQQWRDDSSIRGHVKLRLGLNCFGRTDDEMIELAAAAGLVNLEVIEMASLMSHEIDDVAHESLLIAKRG